MFLDRIIRSVDERVQELHPSWAKLLAKAESRPPVRSLKKALLEAPKGMAVIAESKHRSPSKGWLSEHYDPAENARRYQARGASAVSILTEPEFFAGDLGHLQQVREVASIPVLRKDFVRDEVQLVEARAYGADACLLIVRIIEDDQKLRALFDTARQLGLEVLVEIHQLGELERALRLVPELIGVNNRDLDSFDTRLNFSEEISPLLPPSVVRVSESGIHTIEDVERVRRAGYQAILVGESLMRGGGLLEEIAQWPLP